MEIERKYLITHIPFDIDGYPFHQIEQAYLSTAPVVRVRQEDDTYYLTYKSKGLMAREEYNLPLTKESYEHLRSKADGRILTKKRYLIRMEGTEYTIELDIFLGEYEGLKLAEVEFPSEEAALAFVPPEWFGREVTFTGEYQNSRLVLAEKLSPHLREIDETANRMLVLRMPELMKAAGGTEELKARDQMKWVGLMTSLRAQAEEIILSELVYS